MRQLDKGRKQQQKHDESYSKINSVVACSIAVEG